MSVNEYIYYTSRNYSFNIDEDILQFTINID